MAVEASFKELPSWPRMALCGTAEYPERCHKHGAWPARPHRHTVPCAMVHACTRNPYPRKCGRSLHGWQSTGLNPRKKGVHECCMQHNTSEATAWVAGSQHRAACMAHACKEGMPLRASCTDPARYTEADRSLHYPAALCHGLLDEHLQVR